MTKVKTPTSPAELEEMLQDKAVSKELWDGGPEVLAEFVKDYAKGQMEARSGELGKVINEATQLGYAEWLAGNRSPEGTGTVTPPSSVAEVMAAEATRARAANASLPMARIAARQKLFNKRAIGAQLDAEPYAASIGAFLKGVLATKKENSDDVRAFEKKFRNAMSERVPSSGGFLVPETLRSQILMVALENAVVRPRSRVIPMDSLRLPYPTIDDTSHTSNVFGGVTAYWTEEGAQMTASQPSFGRIVLEARKLTAYTEIPNELMEDAVAALDQWFNEMFPIALAWFEDVGFISGTGIGQPQGFLNSPCAVSVNRATANKVKFADIAAMFPRMLPASLNNAVWLCSPDVIGQLLQLALATGDATTTFVAPPLFLSSVSGAHGGVDYTLMGRPLIVSEKLSALGTKGDLAFVDLGYYLLGDRQAMQIANSDEYKFQNDLTAFRVIERLDGRTWIQSAITPENGGSTLSPVVLLN